MVARMEDLRSQLVFVGADQLAAVRPRQAPPQRAQRGERGHEDARRILCLREEYGSFAG